MEYTVEDLTPVSKKITVSVSPEEVEEIIVQTLTTYRERVELDGFRKGKVPLSMVESRFRSQVYPEATQNLVNMNVAEIMREKGFTPLSGMEVDAAVVERGKDFSYAFSFEVLPDIELPDYSNLAFEIETIEVTDPMAEAIIERMRFDKATEVPVEEDRLPQDGDLVEMDFAAYENGELMKDVQAKNYKMELGMRSALAELDNLIKATRKGQENEADITFPEDFPNPFLAGKTVTMKITLHQLLKRELPEMDEAFLKDMAEVDSVDALREAVKEAYARSYADNQRAHAQGDILEKMVTGCDYPLPESYVEIFVHHLLRDWRANIEKQGGNMKDLGKTPQELREQVLPEAQRIARTQMLLLAIARKENLKVSDNDMMRELMQTAWKTGQDYNELREAYMQSGMYSHLRDRLLADKAMEFMFSKAIVTEVPAKKIDESAAETTEEA